MMFDVSIDFEVCKPGDINNDVVYLFDYYGCVWHHLLRHVTCSARSLWNLLAGSVVR